MANATKLPSRTDLVTSTWSRPDGENPRLARALTSSATTVYFTVAPKKEDSTLITGGFLMGVKNADNVTEQIWVPAGAVAMDGLSATGVVRGIDISGLDYTAASGISGYAMAHEEGEPIFFVISAVIENLVRAAIQGEIATGANQVVLGDETGNDDVKLKRATAAGVSVEMFGHDSSDAAAYYSDNGTDKIYLRDSTASSLVKVSATDTTPDYLQGKVGSSDSSIVFSVTGSGADETLNMTTALPARVSSHAVYIPAYMTGGASAESNVAIWDSVSNGSFRGTFDGTARNIDGIDFTATGPLGIVTSMAEVASVIQYYLRAQTGSTETVVWSTDHFVITSGNTTSSSQVSVLTTSTGTVGTDISGVGTVYMDSETGRGTATAAVLDPTQDSGKIGLLNARGSFPADLARDFVDPLGYQAKGGIMVATAANTVDEFPVGANDFGIRADSSQSVGIKWAPTSRVLGRLTSSVTVTNTTTETDLLSISVPANSLSTTNAIEGEILISSLIEAVGVTNDMAIKFKYGGTTIGTVNINNGTITASGGLLRFKLIAAGATNSQVGWLEYLLQRQSGAVTSAPVWDESSLGTADITGWLFSNGTAAIDSTSAQTLVVTAKWNAADVGNVITAQYGLIKLVA